MITGKYLKELREAAGIPQTELARLAGISQAHIAKIETEKVNPRLSTVNALLTILQKSKKKILCKDVMSKKIISLKPNDNANKSVKMMENFDISQLPVIEKDTIIGSVGESTILKHLDKNLKHVIVRDIMDHPFPIVNDEDPAEMVKDILGFHPAVTVKSKGKPIGIITKHDLLTAR